VLSAEAQELGMRAFSTRLPVNFQTERLARERVPAWEEAIRTACGTLEDASSSEICAASITLARDTEGEAALLCGLVEEIAAECGLDASFKLSPGSFTARLTRRPRSEPPS